MMTFLNILSQLLRPKYQLARLYSVFLTVTPGRSMIKKSDGSNVKESTDSSTTIEEDEVKGMCNLHAYHLI